MMMMMHHALESYIISNVTNFGMEENSTCTKGLLGCCKGLLGQAVFQGCGLEAQSSP